MSIKFEEQKNSSVLTVKRASRHFSWYAWDSRTKCWSDLGRKSKVTLDKVTFPKSSERDNRILAAKYAEQVLKTCDGYHVLIVYRWDEDDLWMALVRSRTEFKAGSRQPPSWTNIYGV